MREEDKRSALVALTEHQIMLLLQVLREPRWLIPEDRLALENATSQLMIAMYAVKDQLEDK